MALLIFYIFVAIAVSFLCSVMEAVLLSITPAHLMTMSKEGHPMAPTLTEWKENIDEPLAAILTLNTIAHTIGAAGAGAQAAHEFGDEWLGVFSAVLTLLILIASEIIPKTLGAVYWKQLAGPVARVLVVIIWPMTPFVKLSGKARDLMAGDMDVNAVSRAEISALADLGAQQGVIAEDESRILRALLRFRLLRAKDIMTPRTVIFALPDTLTTSETIANDDYQRFSRIPVYNESLDDIEGYVLKDDVLERVARDDDHTTLDSIKRKILVVPDSAPVSQLLEKFLASKEHIAVVVDEYGGTEGILTLEDVVETLLDMEIVDEADNVADLQAAARQDWLRRARRLGLVDESGEPTGRRPAADSVASKHQGTSEDATTTDESTAPEDPTE